MLVSAFAKDGGMTMMEALNYAQLDYVSLGNHECLDLVKLNDAEFWNEKKKLLSEYICFIPKMNHPFLRSG